MLPLLCTQILLALCAPPVAAATPPPAPTPPTGASNISANGLPSCSKSSDALVVVPPAAPPPLVAPPTVPAAVAGAAPNRSTIGAPAPLAGGDDKNGFVNAAPAPAPPPPAVGEETFDCLKKTGRKFRINVFKVEGYEQRKYDNLLCTDS